MLFLNVKTLTITMFLMSSAACQQTTPPQNIEPATIEYIAHASFRITDSQGTAIVTDPYNSRIWLGYAYPKGLDADALFITHPHFDHDASYNFTPGIQIYRAPQKIQVGEIVSEGIETEHSGADEMRARGQNPSNTAWVFSLDGRRILQLGDTRPLTEDEITAVGPVDIIISNPDDFDMVDSLKNALGATTVVFMHYGLPEITFDAENGLEPIMEFASDHLSITQLPSNTISIDDLPKGYVSLPPHSDVKRWTAKTIEANGLYRTAFQATKQTPPDYKQAKTLLNRAVELDPGNISFYLFLANIFEREEMESQMIETLELGLKNATDLDWNAAQHTATKLRDYYTSQNNAEIAAKYQTRIDQIPDAYKKKNSP